MRQTTNPHDARVQRSRRDLMDALEELLLTKSFDQITVKDITEKALVSKNTFYNNYSDKEDLLEATFERRARTFHDKIDISNKIKNGLPLEEAYKELATALVDGLCQVPILGEVNIFEHDTSKTLYWAFERFCRKVTARVASVYGELHGLKGDPDLICAFYGGGFANLIYYLMTSGKKIDREKTIATLMEISNLES